MDVAPVLDELDFWSRNAEREGRNRQQGTKVQGMSASIPETKEQYAHCIDKSKARI
jgi:hypothetical protein